jgi:glucokinase
MRYDNQVAGGIDLGGTGSRLVVVGRGEVVGQVRVGTPELGAGTPRERVSRVAGALNDLVPRGSVLAGVGIGASGPIELPRGPIRNPDTLAWFSGFDFVGMLSDELGTVVIIDNDAVTAALGEFRYGAGQNVERLLVVTLGTGIGAAFLADGLPFRDGKGQHPECGHLPVLPGDQRCYCGLVGCWEGGASRTSLELRVRRAIGTNDLQVAQELLSVGHSALEAALSGYGTAIGRGLETLNVVYDPERIVLCGSASSFLPYFRKGMLETMERAPGFRNEVDVVESALGDLAGAVGASVLVTPT